MPKDMMMPRTSDGWIQVLLDDGTRAPLPEFCYVVWSKNEGGRDHITIQEGPYKGRKASIKAGNLVDKKHLKAAEVTFFTKSGVVTWDGGPAAAMSGGRVTGGIPSFTLQSNKVPQGSWDISVPDFPHPMGSVYADVAPHTLTWFLIKTTDSNDRYIHVGTASAGCTTIGIPGDKTSVAGKAALKNFERLYEYLIPRRSKPGVVGKLKVMEF